MAISLDKMSCFAQITTSLGLEDSAQFGHASSPAAQAAPVADLLGTSEPDFLSVSSSPPRPEGHKPQTPAQPAASNPSSDLLGDDFWSEPQTSVPPESQTSGGDLFSGLTVGLSDAAPKQGGGDTAELFAGMNLETGGQVPAANVTHATDDLFGLSSPTASGADSLSDLMGGLSVAPLQAGTSVPPPSGGVKSPPKAAPQAKQPLPPMPMPGFESAQWQQPQGLQGLQPPQQVPGNLQGLQQPQQTPGMMYMGPQQMTPQQMQQMQMAYLHQMQRGGMLMPGMMPFPGGQPQSGFGQGLGGMQPGIGGFMPQQPPHAFGHSTQQNGAHLGGGLQSSGGSLGGSALSPLGAGGSGDLFLNAGIAHSQENKAETKAFDFIAVSFLRGSLSAGWMARRMEHSWSNPGGFMYCILTTFFIRCYQVLAIPACTGCPVHLEILELATAGLFKRNVSS